MWIAVEIVILGELVVIEGNRHGGHHVYVVGKVHLIGDVGEAIWVCDVDVGGKVSKIGVGVITIEHLAVETGIHGR